MSISVFTLPKDLQHIDSVTSPGSSMSSEFEQPRKKRTRAKLDHMTSDQKQERRKEKNRVAAQTARDRKKAKIDHLEDENRKLRMENELLKSQLRTGISSLISSAPAINITDSGISDAESSSKQSHSGSHKDDTEKEPIDTSRLLSAHYPSSPASSTSGAYLVSPSPPATESNDLIDSVVNETDDKAIINEILQFSESIREESGDFASIESAELISKPQQQVQEARFPSSWVENSAGWTSVQLMLLLLISKVHHHFSSRINCCVRTHDRSNGLLGRHSNLYDYYHQTKCPNYRSIAAIIILHKSNVRLQRVAALKFSYKCLYNCRPDVFSGPVNCPKQLQNKTSQAT